MASATLVPTVLSAATEGESGSILLPHTPDLVWGTVCFVIIAVVLIRYALPRFNAVLDERTAKIEEGLNLAEKARSDQAGVEARARRQLEEARLEAARIREAAHTDAAAIVAQARDAASLEAGKALAAAERQIEAEKQAAQISLRTDIGLLATSLAEQIIGEQLTDPAVSSHVIDRFMDQHEADNVRASQQGTRQGAR